MQRFLTVGFDVMCVFSLIFLFYTNSFLIRRRKKELGLYNILGLDKKNLAHVLAWETLIIAGITIISGLFFGILFFKFAELTMIKLLSGEATFAFLVGFQSIFQTAFWFIGIFSLVFLNTLRQIHLASPIELLHSENVGEKPPRANGIIAIAGVVLLAAAYYLAVSIEEPLSAIVCFFVAAVMVIVATYLLFIAGSVALCKVLQKNKNYYYQTRHFVSVSSMAYRMKRNGAGLASICILCTMVLVMVSATVCLYIGGEDTLQKRYSRSIYMDATVGSLDLLTEGKYLEVENLVDEIAERNRTSPENILTYQAAAFEGKVRKNQIIFNDRASANRFMKDAWQIFLVPLADYNRLMGKEETLGPGEALIYASKEMAQQPGVITIGNGTSFTVKKQVDAFVDNGLHSMQIFPTIYLFVPDMNEAVASLQKETIESSVPEQVELHWYYAFDLNCTEETQMQIQEQISDELVRLKSEAGNDSFNIYIEGIAAERAGFYGLYSGLFFLGILLGIVFLFAAVLLIYYKQVSEGYEDQAQFSIMQKVGMTKREIKKSINSQRLIVFFMPLIATGVHLAFAFPLISKLLILYNLVNFPLLVFVTVCCYLVFVLFYMLVYIVTSRTYYSIVSGLRGDGE